jgi:hypothetical protein
MGSMDVKDIARILATTQYDAPPQLGDEIINIDDGLVAWLDFETSGFVR